MEGLHQRSLRQGDPSSLVEMILKVEKRGFRTMEKRDQRFFPQGSYPGYPRREGRGRLPESCKLFSLLKKLCEACLTGGKWCLLPERFTPRLLAPAVFTRMRNCTIYTILNQGGGGSPNILVLIYLFVIPEHVGKRRQSYPNWEGGNLAKA